MKARTIYFLLIIICAGQQIYAQAGMQPQGYLPGVGFIPFVEPDTLSIGLNDNLHYSANAAENGSWPTGLDEPFYIRSLLNTVQLYYQEYLPEYMDFDWTVKVNLVINYDDKLGVHKIETKTLSINYRPEASISPGNNAPILQKQLDLYAFKDACNIEVVVTGATVNSSVALTPDKIQKIAKAVELKADIILEHYDKFDPLKRLNAFDVSSKIDACEILVSWPEIHGAVEYDLEWTFVDNYAPDGGEQDISQLAFNFEKNATRVQITERNYAIPNVFERGYVLFRVRGIGRNPLDLSVPLVGAWSCSLGCPDSYVFGLVEEHGSKIKINTAHTNDRINWQMTAFYAEDGKAKHVVNYADGTFRTRQSVTGLNTEQMTLVGEQYYDHAGRVAVEALPTPVKNECLRFYPRVNRNQILKPYSWKDFEMDVGDCQLEAKPMNFNFGASKYYSRKNTFLPQNIDPFNALIPNAFGYPFSHREYTNDNTGRIARQGGLGELYQLGKGHETKSYYGVASNDELDPLFGNEVGIGKRYRKTLSIDPNEQVSLTYADAAGNTIATCLAGDPPDNLDQLDSYNPKLITVDLLEFNEIDTTAYTLTLNRPILVEAKGDYYFDYTLDAAPFETGDCMTPNVCYDCQYDLTLVLVDNSNCNEIIASYTQAIGQLYEMTTDGALVLDAVGNPILNNVLCSNAQNAPHNISFNVQLEVGSYTLSKILKVSESAAEAYAQHYVSEPGNTCITPFAEFLDEELAHTDFSNCENNCDNIPPDDPAAESCDPYPDPCDVAKETMMQNMSPYGQYGDLTQTVSGTPLYTSSSPVSIYGPNHWGEQWNGNPPFDPPTFNGALVQNLSLDEFVNNFHDTWAERLLPYHPEYHYLEFCWDSLKNTGSNAFDGLMYSTTTYQTALDNNLIEPVSGNPGQFNPLHLLFTDPFMIDVATLADQDFIQDNLGNYLGSGKSMFHVAYITAHCSNTQGNCPGFVESTFSNSTPYANLEWMAYKGLYHSLKERLIQEKYKRYAIDHFAYNGCIGEQSFNFFDHGLSTSYFVLPANLCSASNYHFYQSKQKCFPNVNDIVPGTQQNVYGATGPGLMDDALATLPATSGYLCGHCDMIPGLMEIFRKQYGTTAMNVPLSSLNMTDPALVQFFSPATTFNAKVFSQNGKQVFSIEIPQKNCSFKIEYVAGIDIKAICCFRPLYDPEYFQGAALFSTYVVDVTLSDGSRRTLEIQVPNASCRLDCLSPYPCPPEASVFELQALFNAQLQQNTFFSQHTIPLAEIGPSLVAEQAGGSGFQWKPSTSNGGRKLCVKIKSRNKSCKFEMWELNPKPGFSFSNMKEVLRLQPDYAYPNADGYAQHFLMVIKMASGVIDTVRGKSGCFVLSYCCKEPGALALMVGQNTNSLKQDLQNALNNANNQSNPSSGVSSYSPGRSILLKYPRGHKPAKHHPDCNACPQVLVSGGIFDGANNADCYDPYCDKEEELPVPPTVPNDCEEDLINMAMYNAQQAYAYYLDSLRTGIKKAYMRHCLAASEHFIYRYMDTRHHFTLYYYDQAGLLVKTVPPKGVHPISNAADLAQVKAHRSDPSLAAKYPVHDLASVYTFNSTNQLVKEKIPDRDGPTFFFHDKLDRLVASRNAKQGAVHAYSYTLFDPLGRIVEVGEIKAATGYDLTDAIARNPAQWEDWLSSGVKSQITRTVYDKIPTSLPISQPFASDTNNYRGRVAFSIYDDIDGGAYDHATYYHYDVQGNVNWLIQHDPLLGAKQMRYYYDLVSGNVNALWYQMQQADQFIHRYRYDADNRLIEVKTSPDGIIWDTDARYTYYYHGPLARLELGEQKVQGLDYAYTLQGWLKGVNSASLRPLHDMGKDGQSGALHALVGRDAYGFTLGYYGKDNPTGKPDYTPIGPAMGYPVDFQPHYSNSQYNSMARSLYNGNIRHMTTAIKQFMPDEKPMGYTYGYDQLNRLKGMTAHNGYNVNLNNWLSQSSTQDYKTRYNYDPNGNIKELDRNGNSAANPLAMDRLKYHYDNGNNQLTYVDDDPTISNNYDNDIDDQIGLSYYYDQIGNLGADLGEGLKLEWNVQNKVKEIRKASGDVLKFKYDALGNRISKQFNDQTTFYVRDAQGNVLATYARKPGTAHGPGTIPMPTLTFESAYLYGSKRLGEYQADICLRGPQCPTLVSTTYQPILDNTGANLHDHLVLAPHSNYHRLRGKRRYELSNHLGNVLCVVSDRKLAIGSSGNTGVVDYYEGDVLAAQDYYPFGMLQLDRSNNNVDYCYLFNGMEQDPEIKGNGNHIDFGERGYDSRLGRWLSIDPLVKYFPGNSGFSFGMNSPILFFDIEGEIPWPVNATYGDFVRKSKIERGIKWLGKRWHQGLDINFSGGGNTDNGAPVLATHDAVVKSVRVYNTHTGSAGTEIILESPGRNFETVYMHLSGVEEGIKKGDRVKEKDVIGYLGGSGFGYKGPAQSKKDIGKKGHLAHLHYEIWKLNGKGEREAHPFDPLEGQGLDATPVDPQLWLNTLPVFEVVGELSAAQRRRLNIKDIKNSIQELKQAWQPVKNSIKRIKERRQKAKF